MGGGKRIPEESYLLALSKLEAEREAALEAGVFAVISAIGSYREAEAFVNSLWEEGERTPRKRDLKAEGTILAHTIYLEKLRELKRQIAAKDASARDAALSIPERGRFSADIHRAYDEILRRLADEYGVGKDGVRLENHTPKEIADSIYLSAGIAPKEFAGRARYYLGWQLPEELEEKVRAHFMSLAEFAGKMAVIEPGDLTDTGLEISGAILREASYRKVVGGSRGGGYVS